MKRLPEEMDHKGWRHRCGSTALQLILKDHGVHYKVNKSYWSPSRYVVARNYPRSCMIRCSNHQQKRGTTPDFEIRIDRAGAARQILRRALDVLNHLDVEAQPYLQEKLEKYNQQVAERQQAIKNQRYKVMRLPARSPWARDGKQFGIYDQKRDRPIPVAVSKYKARLKETAKRLNSGELTLP